MKTQVEQRNAAQEFAEYWANKGDEKQESQRFWIDLLQNVLAVVDATKIIDFEKRVKIGATKFIDGYIAETKTIIEQKGAKIDIDKGEKQSDGTELTPFEQAKRYNDNLPYSEKAKWIVVSNFREIRIYDMDREEADKHFEAIRLEDLPREYYRLEFLVDKNNETIRREEELSIEAGKLVDKIYKPLLKQYIEQNESSLRSLNILCVRIVFCLYAEDAGLFATRTSFEDYLRSFNLPNVRKGLIELFKALDTPLEKRSKYDESLKPFPYVNGGLFKDENIEIPNFTQEIIDVICNDCAVFNWSEISPTIFGAVFESTLNPETRRKGGMHYTSIANIHKVIDPLFLDSLKSELNEIKAITSIKERREALQNYQDKISSLKFLDPACGSGNFLTESYLSLAKLEIEALEATKDSGEMFVNGQAKVDISQFFGIEINDFAVTVAKTALWIAESQVNEKINAILQDKKPFLPLTTNAFIVEGNALRMDWSTLKAQDGNDIDDIGGLFSGFTTQVDGTKHEYNYIMGNPPFVGKSYQTAEQKAAMAEVFKGVKNYGNLDFVTSWYKKASDLIQGTNTKCAFVSTNSICQGIAVPPLWKHLFEKGIQIDFAYRTFKWDSESSEKAAVHCVIIGFSCHTDSILLTQNQTKNENGKSLDFPNPCGNIKKIYNADGSIEEAQNINAYLIDAPNIIVEDRHKPLADVPEMLVGSCPTDGGGFILSPEEREEFIKKEPQSAEFIHTYIGSDEFINGKVRYCLWLKDCPPQKLLKMPLVLKRVEQVREFRLASKKEQTRKRAETPTLFAEDRYVPSKSIFVPMVSSENRKYIPMGFIDEEIVPNNKSLFVPNANLYIFGILTSSVHMAWMRVVAGRLESRYSYGATTVYNTFPWCNPTDEQKAKIEKAAQAILDARAKYADCTLAQLYGESAFLFPELVKAHEANDKAVMKAYGFKSDMSEAEIVAELFKMYEKLIAQRSC